VPVVQETATRDVDANVHRIRALFAQHPGADIAIFPELFVTGYQVDRLHELAFGAEDGVLPAIQLTCYEFGTTFVRGSRVVAANGPVLCDFGSEVHSAVFDVPPRGAVAAEVDYRRRHLRPELYV
jgi:predicted amidohydrolase